MRAAETEQTDSVGISGVWQDFARIGWGPVENARHDLGTDLYLQVRDERRFDLGLVVGAQVKSGQSYFSRPRRSAHGDIDGWWFNDTDREHVDLWLKHALPHLLVLRDTTVNVSYWVHVTQEAVVPTGKGAKIFVPKGNVVDLAHRDELLQIAATGRPPAKWEGSIWTAGRDILPKDRLRHALVAPRTVAPHPNAGSSSDLSGVQAVALVVQARFADYQSYAEISRKVPHLTEAASSNQWIWQFVAALSQRVRTGDATLLIHRIADAPDPGARTAATVAAVTCHIEDGRYLEAQELLERALAVDDTQPVDHAWLHVHRARLLIEVGQVEEGRAQAAPLPAIRHRAPDDVTASGIAAAATAMLFNTAAWDEKDLADRITGADNAVSWWRSQTTSHGLEAMVDRTFRAWAPDGSFRWDTEDIAAQNLYSAALAANHLGDHDGWRYLQSLQARDELLRVGPATDPTVAARGLDGLRMAGDAKSLKRAARHLERDGPAVALRTVATAIDLNRSSRTTSLADLVLIECAADLLDESSAGRTVRWLVERIKQPALWSGGVRTIGGYHEQLLASLAAVVPSCSDAQVQPVIELLVSLDGIEHPIEAEAWAKVARSTPDSAWSPAFTERATAAADSHHDTLRIALLGRGAIHDPEAMDVLVADALEGSLAALSELGPVAGLPIGVAEAATRSFSASVASIVADARRHTYGLGMDAASGLVLLNAWHPHSADWPPVLNLLREPLVATDTKRTALQYLSANADRLPPSICDQLRPIVAHIAGGVIASASVFASGGSAAGEAVHLGIAIAAFDDAEIDAHLAQLGRGDSHDRRWAAHVARRRARSEDCGFLAALAADSDIQVRAAALAGLAVMLVRGAGGSLARSVLNHALEHETGTRVGEAVIAAIADEPGPAADEIKGALHDHASCWVRRAARAQRTDD